MFPIYLSAQPCECTNCPLPITDNGSFSGYLDVTVDGPNDLDQCSLEQVCFTIDHTWIGDLSVSLTSPSGLNYLVMADANNGSGGCGTNEDDLEVCVLIGDSNPLTGGTEYACNNGGAGPCLQGDWTVPCNVTDPFGGASQAPNCNLDDFNVPGDPANGTWALTVNDVCAADNGHLVTWSLVFSCGVVENIDPIAVCQDITIELDDDGFAYIFPPDIDGGSYDNCALSYLEIDQSAFDCNSPMLNNVTLTAFDESGNTGTCIAEVAVIGTDEPIVLTQTENACGFYYWNVTNEIYFESGLITETSSSGICDTVYVLDLNIGEITDYTILVNGGTISTTNNTASYQWLDCDDDYAPITGATNQSYTPPSSGNFALELTEGGCVDTTACVYVVPTSTTDLQSNTLSIYPNPTQDLVTISLDSPSRGILKAYDLQGRLIHSQPVQGQRSLDYTLEGEAGLYLIEFVDVRGEVYVGKVVKM